MHPQFLELLPWADWACAPVLCVLFASNGACAGRQSNGEGHKGHQIVTLIISSWDGLKFHMMSIRFSFLEKPACCLFKFAGLVLPGGGQATPAAGKPPACDKTNPSCQVPHCAYTV